MNLDIIRDEKSYRAALDRIRELTPGDREVAAGSREARELDVLTVLVHHYEQEHEAPAPPEPIAAIEFALDQGMLKGRDQLEKALGGPSRVSEVMNRRRGLSIGMIRNLVALGVPAASLIGRIRLARSRRGGAELVKERPARYRRTRRRSEKRR